MIEYTIGDASHPAPCGNRYSVIAHVCNDVGKFGAGFAKALAKRWPQLGNFAPLPLGTVQWNHVEMGLSVVNMVAQHGVRSKSNPQPLDYHHLGLCLARVSAALRGRAYAVHMPRIGTGLAGGSWDRVEPLIERHLTAVGLPVLVYDLPT